MENLPDYRQQDVRDGYSKKLEALMDKAWEDRHHKNEESKQLYDSMTHYYIYDNAYELFFPLEKERWPEKFQEKYLDIQHMSWPGYTSYCYIMDVIAPPFIPYFLLHFGYAVVDNKLIPCTFFVVQKIVDFQNWPQGMVIDPLASYHGVKPSFYIGSPVPDKNISKTGCSIVRIRYLCLLRKIPKRNTKKKSITAISIHILLK